MCIRDRASQADEEAAEQTPTPPAAAADAEAELQGTAADPDLVPASYPGDPSQASPAWVAEWGPLPEGSAGADFDDPLNLEGLRSRLAEQPGAPQGPGSVPTSFGQGYQDWLRANGAYLGTSGTTDGGNAEGRSGPRNEHCSCPAASVAAGWHRCTCPVIRAEREARRG